MDLNPWSPVSVTGAVTTQPQELMWYHHMAMKLQDLFSCSLWVSICYSMLLYSCSSHWGWRCHSVPLCVGSTYFCVPRGLTVRDCFESQKKLEISEQWWVGCYTMWHIQVELNALCLKIWPKPFVGPWQNVIIWDVPYRLLKFVVLVFQSAWIISMHHHTWSIAVFVP